MSPVIGSVTAEAYVTVSMAVHSDKLERYVKSHLDAEVPTR